MLTFREDISGVLDLITKITSRFGYDQSKALVISITLYNQGYANLESLRETVADPQYHKEALAELNVALKEELSVVEILQIVAFAEGQS